MDEKKRCWNCGFLRPLWQFEQRRSTCAECLAGGFRSPRGRKAEELPARICVRCARPFERRRYANGRLEERATFAKRTVCWQSDCVAVAMANARTAVPMTDAKLLDAAERVRTLIELAAAVDAVTFETATDWLREQAIEQRKATA